MKTGLKAIRLIKGRERSAKRFHPWIFSGAIEEKDKEILEGDLVEVQDSRGEFVACGFYSESSIAIKVFSFNKVLPDQSYWESCVRHAQKLRSSMGFFPGAEETNAFRLINAEGDGIPGLVIDIYDSLAVIQCHSRATFRLLDCWKDALQAIYGDSLKTIYVKSSDTIKSEEQNLSEVRDIFLKGDSGSLEIKENGMLFQVDCVEGQKTGFFVDQRDNRKLVQSISMGRRVLNLFSYSGGFSVAAALGGAEHVTSVDISAAALELCKQNMTLNGIEDHRSTIVEQDSFKFLEQDTTRYDLIIVDPPPFAKSRASLEKALQGYKAINNLAMKRLEKQGAILTFSCSQVVGVDAFMQAVTEAAVETGRQLRIVRELSSPDCHPVSLFHPEGDYLKGLYCTM